MSDIKYSQDHEWVIDNGDGTVTIGITDFAQAQLGDLVYVEIPEEGTDIEKGEAISVIESVKAASDLIAPVSGTIVAVNESLDDEPEQVNDSAMDAWFIRVQYDAESDLNELMDEDAYHALIEAS